MVGTRITGKLLLAYPIIIVGIPEHLEVGGPVIERRIAIPTSYRRQSNEADLNSY